MSDERLPKGYKNTEVGVIPEDWKVEKLGNIADVKTGPFGSLLHESDYVTNGTPIITVEHLVNFGIEQINLPMVSDQDKARLKLYCLKEGDIVFSRVGSIDRNAMIKKSESGWLFSGRLLRIRLNNQKESPHYLSYHFDSKPFKQRVKDVAVGQTMPSINTKILKDIKVVIPTEKEQKAIATTLSNIDNLITALDKLIGKKRDIKTVTMQQLLTGKKRLPGFGEGKGYKNVEVGIIPEDWEVQRLDEIAILERGKFSARPRNNPKLFGGDVPFIQTGDVSRSNGRITSYSQTLNEKGLRVSKSFPKDTLFLTIAANIGDLAIASFETACPDSLIAIFPKSGIDKIWLFQALKKLKPELEVLATQNAQFNLNLEKLNPYVLAIPPLPEQKAIASILSNQDEEITALEKRLAKTKAIKQGMMQELLTGKTRLINNG